MTTEEQKLIEAGILAKLKDYTPWFKKDLLTTEETAKYLGISLSKLYKMTCNNEIPFYKPNGRYNYFALEEVKAWAMRNRVPTNDEIRDRAQMIGR
ncbi:MAG: helix-turn-helix domain-containing protein [Bacteroidales bacterium]|nr:helix-turn-helix domain-containing protein [Bacteroidales bacterium]